LEIITIGNFICFWFRNSSFISIPKNKESTFLIIFQLLRRRFKLIHHLLHVYLVLLTLLCMFWLILSAFLQIDESINVFIFLLHKSNCHLSSYWII
jgi:hypothetical protein